MTRDTVVFVEDPGAVNSIAPLVTALREAGTPARLFSAGHATALLGQRGLSSAVLADHGLDEAFVGDPRLLLVGTSENTRTLAFDLIERARAVGIPSVAIIDSSANAEFRFRGLGLNPLRHTPDHLLVPDADIRQSFVDLGLSATRIHVVGHPNDDRVRAIGVELAAEGRDNIRNAVMPCAGARRVIVFVSEVSDGLEDDAYRRSTDYTLHGRGDRHLRTEIVVEELLDAVTALQSEGIVAPYLILRRHPKETDRDLVGLAAEFDEVSYGGDPHRLIFAADVVVGMTTMLLTEAVLLGVPALSILPREREVVWLSSLRDGTIPIATTRPDLAEQLRQLLADMSCNIVQQVAPVTEATRRILAVLDEVAT